MIHNLDTSIDLESMRKFMLYEIDKQNYTVDKKQDYKNKFNTEIPKNLLKINYTKKNSKYNEPEKIFEKKILNDKLFWCFYKLLHNLCDSDLETVNCFKIEKEFKINCIDLIREKKQLLKREKIQKIFVEDDLTNNKIISLKTFQCLCLLYSINVLIIKNNIYSKFCYNINKESVTSENFNFIKITPLHDNKFSNFDIEIIYNMCDDEINKIIESKYYIENLEKPFKGLSYYKLDDLINIAEKLNINYYTECNKKMKKQDLYLKIINTIQ